MSETAAVPEETAAPAVKRTKYWVITSLALLLMAAVIFVWQYNANQVVKTDFAKVTGDTVDISPKIGGRLEKLPVKEGDNVKAGQLIASLDNSQYKLALEQARANLVQAQSNLQKLPMDQKSAQAACNKAQEAAHAAQAQLQSSQIALEDAQRMLEKGKSMLAAGAISTEALAKYQSDYDKALAALDMNQANLLAAQASVADARAKQEIVNKTSGTAYQSQLRLAQAAYDLALLNYNNTFIKAPVAGKVVRITEKIGENVSAGQTVMTICDLDSTWIVASIDEKKIGRIKPGQIVEVSIDAYPDKIFKGRVDSISGVTKSVFSMLSTESTSGNYTKVVQYLPVKITVDHDGYILRSGMSATVKVKVKD